MREEIIQLSQQITRSTVTHQMDMDKNKCCKYRIIELQSLCIGNLRFICISYISTCENEMPMRNSRFSRLISFVVHLYGFMCICVLNLVAYFLHAFFFSKELCGKFSMEIKWNDILSILRNWNSIVPHTTWEISVEVDDDTITINRTIDTMRRRLPNCWQSKKKWTSTWRNI